MVIGLVSRTGMAEERLFFALWPPGDLGARMHALARSRVQRGRVLPAERLHVTLIFLGEVDAAGRDAALAAGDRVSGQSFELGMDVLGCWRRRGIVWLGPAQTPEQLSVVHDRLGLALETAGFRLERRRFRPHVTLARRAVARPETLEKGLTWRVGEIHLVRSRLGDGGAAYTTVRTWPLHGGQG